jgi:hypothetical protein
MIKNKQSTGKVDYMLKGSIDSLKFEIKNIEKLLHNYENEDPTTKGIKQSEKDKRIKLMKGFLERADPLIAQVRESTDNTQAFSNLVNNTDLESQNYREKRGEDGEYDDTRGQTNRQLL